MPHHRLHRLVQLRREGRVKDIAIGATAAELAIRFKAAMGDDRLDLLAALSLKSSVDVEAELARMALGDLEPMRLVTWVASWAGAYR